MKSVVIIGAGFGGLNAAQHLKNIPNLKVTCIDQRNHHLFQPLLYQVATAGLSPGDIATPIRSILGNVENTNIILGKIENISLPDKTIQGTFGSLKYDFLILACGSQTYYFNHPDWEEYALGLKTLEEATQIRQKILLAFEQAEIETDQKLKEALLTFIVIGGGPTGVEIAGAIAELSRNTLTQEFKNIDPKKSQVILIEGGSRILPSFPESLSTRALKDLRALGVTVYISSLVTRVTQNSITLKNGLEINAHNIIWAAGVGPSALNQSLGVPLDHQGRIIVQPDLSLKDYPEVFVVGDQASFTEKGKILPGLAPVAIQQGHHAAKNILRLSQNKQPLPFNYWDKGQLATIGRSLAVGEFKGIKFQGFFAWVAWLLIHIYYLIGFRNRILVLIQWAWSYVSFKRGVRLIVERKPLTSNHSKEE